MKLLFKKYGTVKSKVAFTLAEAVIILVLLGTVSAIVIPSTITNYNNSVRRAKMKQALETYSTVVKSMVSENNFRSIDELNEYAIGPHNTCANTRKYFKPTDITNGGCSFKTSNGLWWTIRPWDNNKKDKYGNSVVHIRMNKVLVSFIKPENKNFKNRKGTSVPLYELSEDLLDSRAFYLSSFFDRSGNFRVMDYAYNMANGNSIKDGNVNLMSAIKLYGFINNIELRNPENGLWRFCQKDPETGETIKRNCIMRDFNGYYFFGNSKYSFLFYECRNDDNIISKDSKIDENIKNCGLVGTGSSRPSSFNPEWQKDEKGNTVPFIDPWTKAQYSDDFYNVHTSPRCNLFGDYCYSMNPSISLKRDCVTNPTGCDKCPAGKSECEPEEKIKIERFKAPVEKLILDTTDEDGNPKKVYSDSGVTLKDVLKKSGLDSKIDIGKLEKRTIIHGFIECSTGPIGGSTSCYKTGGGGITYPYRQSTSYQYAIYASDKDRAANNPSYTVEFAEKPYLEGNELEGYELKIEYLITVKSMGTDTAVGWTSKTYKCNENWNGLI